MRPWTRVRPRKRRRRDLVFVARLSASSPLPTTSAPLAASWMSATRLWLRARKCATFGRAGDAARPLSSVGFSASSPAAERRPCPLGERARAARAPPLSSPSHRSLALDRHEHRQSHRRTRRRDALLARRLVLHHELARDRGRCLRARRQRDRHALVAGRLALSPARPGCGQVARSLAHRRRPARRRRQPRAQDARLADLVTLQAAGLGRRARERRRRDWRRQVARLGLGQRRRQGGQAGASLSLPSYSSYDDEPRC